MGAADTVEVDDVLMGQVLQAGVGQAPARQAALRAGLPDSTSATTINRVCGSGLKSIMLAASEIRAGDAELVIAGGMAMLAIGADRHQVHIALFVAATIGVYTVVDSHAAREVDDITYTFASFTATGVIVSLYGVATGGLFAGESMFHHTTDASKAAVIHLDRVIAADGDPRRIIDVQWSTPHLASLGVVEVARSDYARMLRGALQVPLPAPWR